MIRYMEEDESKTCKNKLPREKYRWMKKGQMAVDATYLYICVDTDTWTRVALAW